MTMSITTPAARTTRADPSLTRLHLMRAGYLLMGVGLVLVKWPLLPDAAALPLFEGVTLCLFDDEGRETPIDIPTSNENLNSYPIAALADSKKPGLAEEWVDLVTGSQGQQALADAGFGRP